MENLAEKEEHVKRIVEGEKPEKKEEDGPNFKEMFIDMMDKNNELQDFFCKMCDYSTCRKSQYERHLMTPKHQLLINPNKNVPSSSVPSYVCVCGKIYKHASSLCGHKKNVIMKKMWKKKLKRKE